MLLDYQIYNIVVAVLTGLGLIASTVFLVMGLRSVKTRSDPSRKTFVYMKAGLCLLVLGSILHFITSIFYVWLTGGVSWSGSDSTYEDVIKAAAYVYETAELLLQFCDCCVVISLALLDRGISIANTSGSPTRASSLVAKLLTGLVVLAGLMYFVTWALALHIYTVQFDPSRAWEALFDLQDMTYTWCGMRLGFWVIMTVSAVTLLVRAITGFSKGHAADAAGHASRFFLTATSVYLIRVIFQLVVWILNTMLLTGEAMFLWPRYYDVLRTVIGYYPLIVTLALLVFLGRKQLKGLWSDGRYVEPQAAAPKHRPYDSA
ncbi:hypothetical protein LIA77_01961 [Sarocladium implicatum]|nr:hypothetical protein LIA77_01961 [Sarocladium implicatum]